MELDALRDPQRLAVGRQGARHGAAVAAGLHPARRRRRCSGNPTPASADDAVRINPLPAPKPASLKPAHARGQGAGDHCAGSRADTRGTSTAPSARRAVGRRPATHQRPSPEHRIDTSPAQEHRQSAWVDPCPPEGRAPGRSRCCSRSSGRGCSSSRAWTPRPTPRGPRPPGLVTIDLPAKRGRILDRNGVPLAESIAGMMIVADPTRTTANAEAIAKILADRLHLDYFDLLDQADQEERHAASSTSPAGSPPRSPPA